MRGGKRIAVIAALGISISANAQEFAETICERSLRDNHGVIDPRVLRGSALKGVSVQTLDYDNDGTPSADEIFLALTMDAFDFCRVGTANLAGRAVACEDGEEMALRQANARLSGFWRGNNSLFEVATLARPNEEDLRTRPGLGSRPWAPLLDERGRFARATCRPAPGAPQNTDTAQTPTPTAKGSLAFLLGKDIDSLTVSRAGKGRDRLAKVTPAEISFTSNSAANISTFAIDAVAGLRLADRADFKLTPFVQYARSEVRDWEKDETELSGKFAVGAISTLIFGDDQIDLTPLYARDLDSHAEFLTGRVAWRPGFLYRLPSFNNAYHFACRRTARGKCEFGNGLAVWTDVQLIGSFGSVLDKGNDPAAIVGKDYVRLGPSGAIHIYGLSGLAEDMSLDITYKRLFRISGDKTPVYVFKADLSYWIAGSEHVSFTAGYERGRDEETLKLTDEWKVALGIRF